MFLCRMIRGSEHGRSRYMPELSLSCHKLGEKWRPRGRRSFFWLHLNLRRVVEVVDRGSNNLNIPLSDQLAAGRKEYILLNDRVHNGLGR